MIMDGKSVNILIDCFDGRTDELTLQRLIY